MTSTSNFRRLTRALLSTVLLALASCGGGETDTEPKRVARIEVSPSSVLLSAAGQVQALRVRALAEDGSEVDGARLTFTSSRPQIIQVDARGQVSAGGGLGAAWIEVSADGVTSAPVPVVAARPKVGVMQLADDQFLASPTLVTLTDTLVGSRLRVELVGQSGLSEGTLLLATQGTPVAGRVVEVLPAASGRSVVIVEVVSLDVLFNDLDVDIEVTPEQSRRLAAATQAPRLRTALGDRRPASGFELVRFGNAECLVEAETALLDIDLYATVDFESAAHFRVGVVGGRPGPFLVALKLGYDGKVGLRATLGQANGQLNCRYPMLRLAVPVPGFLQLVFQPFVPLGVQASGKIKASSNASLVAECWLRGELTAGGGLDDQLQPFNLSSGSTDHDCDIQPEFDPDALNPRLEADLFAGVLGQIEVQSWVAKLAGLPALEIVEGRAGLESTHAWSPPAGDALDTAFANSFRSSLVYEVSSTDKLNEMLAWISSGLPVTVDLDLAWQDRWVLGGAPAAKAVTVNRNSFTAGDLLTFDIELDPLTTDYPSTLGIYNVHQVRVYRIDRPGVALATAEVITSEIASDGQTRFRLTWTADRDGVSVAEGTPMFHAFVVPRVWDPLRDLMPISLGAARSTAPEIRPARAIAAPGSRIQFEAFVDGQRLTEGVDWSTSGGSIDTTGLFVAGPAAGEFTVVAVAGPAGIPVQAGLTIQALAPGFFVTGTVTSTTGQPIAGAQIDLAVDGTRLSTRSEADGLYHLQLTETQYNRLPSSFIVVASHAPLHHPMTTEIRRSAGGFVRQDFVLLPVSDNPMLLSIELVPDVHHLGNSNFSGSQNSQFQYPRAEGPSFSRTFTVSDAQIGFAAARLRFIARGVQCGNVVSINGVEVARTANSPVDGSVGHYEYSLDPSILQAGEGNRFVVQASTCSDMDDFEFSNAQIDFF